MKTFYSKISALLLAALCVVATTVSSQGYTITFNPSGPNADLVGTGSSPANPSLAELSGLAGESLTFQYKMDQGAGSDDGSFAGSYETTFSNTPTDPQDAFIDYIGGPAIAPTAYLLVKDGNSDPTWYFFRLTDWAGTEDITLTGFWANDRGAISHVSIYNGPSRSVPDGGSTALLLGLSFLGLAAVSRKRSA